jgi:hypothetical protein
MKTKTKPIFLYKSMSAGMKSAHGDIKWEINKWFKEDGELSICNKGFHASELVIDAMGYVSAKIIAKVEMRGKSIKQDDKQCWSEMRLDKVYKWTKEDSVKLSIFAAELCLKNYEKAYPKDDRPRNAIEAAKYWLKHQNDSAAYSACSAAYSAAYSASSACSAASSAAYSAVKEKCSAFVLKLLSKKTPLKK